MLRIIRAEASLVSRMRGSVRHAEDPCSCVGALQSSAPPQNKLQQQGIGSVHYLYLETNENDTAVVFAVAPREVCGSEENYGMMMLGIELALTGHQ